MDNTRVLSNHWGIRAVFVELEMRGNTIKHNRTNGVSLRDSKANIFANHISDNRRGIYLQRSTGKISGNQIENNREHGIYLEESIADVQGNRISRNGRSGVKVLDSEGRMESNSILLNGEFSFYNAGKADFPVGSNWYGKNGRQAVLMDGLSREGLGLLKLTPPLIQQPEVRTF